MYLFLNGNLFDETFLDEAEALHFLYSMNVHPVEVDLIGEVLYCSTTAYLI